MKGNTEPSDFLCEQPGLVDQSRSCIWCHKIFHCIDVDCPTKAHPYCGQKWLAENPDYELFDPEDMM